MMFRHRTYGEDEYGRYVEIDGERCVIEPFPFKHPWYKLLHRIDIVKWHIFRNRNV